MGMNKPKDGAPGTTDQSPRWEGPQENTPPGCMPAKDDPDRAEDANGETNADSEVKKISDGLKQKVIEMTDVEKDAKGQYAKSVGDRKATGVASAKPTVVNRSEDATEHKAPTCKKPVKAGTSTTIQPT